MGNKHNPRKHSPLMRDLIKKRTIELLSGKEGEFTHQAIAQKVSQELNVEISRQTITRIYSQASKDWQKGITQDIDSLKLKQINRLEALYNEYEQLYLESSADEVTIYRVVSGNVGQENTDSTKSANKASKRELVRKKIGDKAILDSMRQVITEQNKLLGLMEQKVVHSGKVEVDVARKRFADMTEEELQAFLKENSQYLNE